MISASTPSRAISLRRCSGSAPDFCRSRSSPWKTESCNRDRWWPSETLHFTPFSSTSVRGRRSAYFASRRSFHRFAGSFIWLSHEIIKYLFGSLGRAVRSQPACPALSNRHWFGASIISNALLTNFFICSLNHFVIITLQPPLPVDSLTASEAVQSFQHGYTQQADRAPDAPSRVSGSAHRVPDLLLEEG